MQINGLITAPGWKQNKEKTKENFSFKFTPNGEDKYFSIYLRKDDTELQAQAMACNKKHVTLEGDWTQSNGKDYFNPTSITESEAPKQEAKKEQPTRIISKDEAIDTAVAIKAAVELACAGKCPTAIADKMLAWIDARIPLSAPTAPKSAPEPSVVKANKAQIFNLKKWVKAKGDAELLVMAEGRVGRDLASLEELTIDEADLWLNEVKAKK